MHADLTEFRRTGTVEPFASVDVAELLAWISAIPFVDWPQQHTLNDGQLRPAMVNDLYWFEFALRTNGIVGQLMALFPWCMAHNRMLSVVMPGHSIPPHCDQQEEKWICRVHVPLTGNERSMFIVGGVAHIMQPGEAYKVNTLAEHSVENSGTTPRIHFMFDVKQ